MEKETRHRGSSFNESEDCYDEEKPKVSSEEIQSELENLQKKVKEKLISKKNG